MAQNRTSSEAIKDKILLLYLLSEYQKERYSIGITKLTKISFLCEIEMLKEKLKGFNYKFFRHYFGPMSKDIYEDIEILTEAGFLNQNLSVSKSGEELLDNLKATLNKGNNKYILQKIDKIISTYGKYDLPKLKHIVYNLKITPVGQRKEETIENLSLAIDLIEKINSEDASKEFELDEDSIDSVYLSIKHAKSNDLKIPSSLTLRDIFSKN